MKPTHNRLTNAMILLAFFYKIQCSRDRVKQLKSFEPLITMEHDYLIPWKGAPTSVLCEQVEKLCMGDYKAAALCPRALYDRLNAMAAPEVDILTRQKLGGGQTAPIIWTLTQDADGNISESGWRKIDNLIHNNGEWHRMARSDFFQEHMANIPTMKIAIEKAIEKTISERPEVKDTRDSDSFWINIGNDD